MKPGFACLFCGEAAASDFLAGCTDRYLGTPGTVDYGRCAGCGLVQQHPLPADVAALYADYPVHRPKSRFFSRLRRALMAGVYRPPGRWPPGSRLLDYGCGDGGYLAWCIEAGLVCAGFEPDARHAQALAQRLGVPVFADIATLAAENPAAFDVVTLHFVAEHLADPRAVLAALAPLLKPGGTIRYVVPAIDSWEARLFGRRWHGLDPPRHLCFPDAGHARRLAGELGLLFDGERPVPFPNGFGGSLPTALFGSFNIGLFYATLPLSLAVTRLFPGGHRAYSLRRPPQPTASASAAP